MSEVGREMLKFQEKLAAERGYTPVEIDLFLGDVREKYLNCNDFLQLRQSATQDKL